MSVFSTTNKTGFSTSLEHIAYSSADATTSDIVISPYSIVVHDLQHQNSRVFSSNIGIQFMSFWH